MRACALSRLYQKQTSNVRYLSFGMHKFHDSNAVNACNIDQEEQQGVMHRVTSVQCMLPHDMELKLILITKKIEEHVPSLSETNKQRTLLRML